jgi:Lon-like ATP-dependent protease
MTLGVVIAAVQFFFAVVIGLYFWNLLRTQQGSRAAVQRESSKELKRLKTLREVSLSEPLSEKTRPRRFDDIVGQGEGVRALKAALCGPNPQHVIVYGPPGVGKTAAARLVLEYARKNEHSPFGETAPFVEMDGTTARFDERGIADPLIGSVHDPIYQGAGPMGMAGIPQPKSGAVTKAHGGLLFIDELGELHPLQLNKLLKVLEDRKVFLESAYYSPDDPSVPEHVKDIFENGLPADFRLVGATTRSPQELPPAIRSRCLEVFFRPLLPSENEQIAVTAAERMSKRLDSGARAVVRRYAENGRDAVNMIQIAAGRAEINGGDRITQQDLEWVVRNGRYNARIQPQLGDRPAVGVAYGLAVQGTSQGAIVEIEAACHRAADREGRLRVTGMIEEEELDGRGRTARRTSMARSSLENVLTVLTEEFELAPQDYDIHVNFPGGLPMDGPSAGVTLAVALYSALVGTPVRPDVAMTGEISLRGQVRPVGGVITKLETAGEADAAKVLIPEENWQQSFRDLDIDVVPVCDIHEVLRLSLTEECVEAGQPGDSHKSESTETPAASAVSAVSN